MIANPDSFPSPVFSKLRITVNMDPIVSSRDQQCGISLLEFVQPFSDLSRLEVDYTILAWNDSRIKDQLDVLPHYEDLTACDFGGNILCAGLSTPRLRLPTRIDPAPRRPAQACSPSSSLAQTDQSQHPQ